MISRFECMSDKLKEILIASLQHDAYFSEIDGFYVISIRCAKCSRVFEEELEAAKIKVISRADFLCLACDVDADAPAVKGITAWASSFIG